MIKSVNLNFNLTFTEFTTKNGLIEFKTRTFDFRIIMCKSRFKKKVKSLMWCITHKSYK